MARKRRPKAWGIGPARVSVVRGPREDGRWYWRARVRGSTALSMWGTKEEVEAELIARIATDTLELVEAEAVCETVGDLLGFWTAHIEDERQDLAERTHALYEARCRTLKEGLGEVAIGRLDHGALTAYAAVRRRQGAAPRSIHQELSTLRTAWTWGRRMDLVEGELQLPKVKITDVRTRRTPTREEVAAVLEHLTPGWCRVAVLLAYGTGARRGELAGLRWRDVDLEREELVVDGKTGPRPVPLVPDLVVELQRWKEETGGKDGDRILGVSLATAASFLDRALVIAAQRAKVPRWTMHGLRRLAVDELLRAGVDIGTACAITGHSAQVMLAYYRQATDADKRAAVKRARLGMLPAGKVINFPGGEG